MAKYKVSYKILSQQGESLKAVAKLVDGYAERVNSIRGKLGEDDMLAEVRVNLQKLSTQLGESRTILSTAGEILSKSVESYTSVENRQVKKVDSLKAHNRDFYKNPVVVASAGAGAATPTSTTTYNYTETNINYNTAAPVDIPAKTSVDAVPMSVPVTGSAAAAAASTAAGGLSAGNAAAIGAGAGVLAGAGAVIGAARLKKERDKDRADHGAKTDTPPPNSPEAQLAEAMERVRRLDEEG